MKLSADVPVVRMLREIVAVILFTQKNVRFKQGQLTFAAVFQATDRRGHFRNTVT